MDKLDMQKIEEGCSMLKEASNILLALNKDIFKLKDYCSKDYLMLKDLNVEDNIDLCASHIQSTGSCLDDYIEDFLTAIRQLGDGGE